MMNATLRGKPDAGNPHVRFDEGEVAPAKPRRGSLLYNARTLSTLVLCVGSAACALAGGNVSKTVETASVGPVAVTCKDAGRWSFAVSEESSPDVSGGARSVVTVALSSPTEARPPVFEVSFGRSGADVTHVWTASYKDDPPRLWPVTWGSARYGSQLASDAPLAVAFNDNDRARFAMAASEAMEKVTFGLGARETTCRLEGRFRFFTEVAAPRKSYAVKILLDARERPFCDAVRETSDWIGRTALFTPASVPEAARDPLYSSWYAFMQDVHADELEREAARAARLGMKTMILDDGWQKTKSASFYSATGDWMPVPDRFPDMKAHVAAVHRAGLKYMLWLSVPFVGDESKAWGRFQGKFIDVWGEKSPGRVGLLDPRFPEVREYLIATYERAVRDWGYDGLKLDFIDRFALTGKDPAEKDAYAGRDCKSLPQAVDRLMKDVLARLRAINPDVLLEFRQRYMGPAIRQYGNMIRAADCPADPQANRVRIANLRLTSGETAVHADMLTWSFDETPEGAALPILNALFGTIQYSVNLGKLPKAHEDVIRHWIGFTEAHRGALQKGAFRPHHPELNYPVIEAESAAERIIAAYDAGQLVETGAADRTVYVVNATAHPSLAVSLAKPARVTLCDTVGAVCGTRALPAGITRLAVPAAGYARIAYVQGSGRMKRSQANGKQREGDLRTVR